MVGQARVVSFLKCRDDNRSSPNLKLESPQSQVLMADTSTLHRKHPPEGRTDWSETAFADNGEWRITYQTCGNATHPCIVLVHGIGPQMIGWSDAFCRALESRGYVVVRMDNRDIGRSGCASARIVHFSLGRAERSGTLDQRRRSQKSEVSKVYESARPLE